MNRWLEQLQLSIAIRTGGGVPKAPESTMISSFEQGKGVSVPEYQRASALSAEPQQTQKAKKSGFFSRKK